MMNLFRSAQWQKRPDHEPNRPARPPEFRIESGLFTPRSAETSWALFAPQHYERNYAYPLIVWLHGAGDDEGQLLRVMPAISMRNYVAVAPRGVLLRNEGGDCWGWSDAPELWDEAEQRVFDAVEAARHKYHVHPGRVFAVGTGCGGTAALRIAAAWPDRFAGAASIGGPLPDAQYAPLNRWGHVRRLPVLLSVGSQSQSYPTARACDDLRLLRTAGVTSITLREYHPCETPLIPQALRDVDRWVMEHVAAAPDAAHRRDSCRLSE